MSELLLLLQFATPLALAALGETVTQKSGVINIGLEGSMLVGAFFGVSATMATGSPWFGLGVGVAAGLALALLSSFFAIALSADQVVVGTAATLLATGLTGTLYRARFGQAGVSLSVEQLPSFGGFDLVMLIAILAVPAIWFGLNRTGIGLALRAVGEYPKAAEAAGFRVNRIRTLALAFGGAMGGLAGGYLALGIVGSFAENMVAGRGFVAIAMVTFGRWKPLWVFAACLLIGYLESLQFLFQAKGVRVPEQLLIGLPYAAALLILVVVGKGTLAPAALATPYRRGK